MSEPTYAERRAAALAALAADDPAAAFRELRWTLWYPRAVAPAELTDALGVFTRVFAALGQRELAERTAHAHAAPQDTDGLYELGYQLIEDGLPAIAATVLGHCLTLAPDSEQVVTELVAALERELAHGDARRVLDAHPALLERSFLCRYLRAYNAAMAGDLATTRADLVHLVPVEPMHAAMVDRIAGIVARADVVTAAGAARLDATDLRGWHRVLTGGMLGHVSPHGFAEGMHGRYAWLQDSPPLVRLGLERLAAVLAAWDLRPPCVYAPPGRDHEILGAAAARWLDLPLMPWPVVGLPAPGLVVAYDLGSLGRRELEQLVERRADQVLFAHVTTWTEDGAIAADVTTLLAQQVVPAWAAQLRIDPVTRAATQGEADARPAAEVAQDLVAAAAPADEDQAHDDVPGLIALAQAIGPPPAAGRRERAWAGGPVPSNRFV